MSIKKKLPLIFTILILMILFLNNVIHYIRSQEELLQHHEQKNKLMAHELTTQVQLAKEGSLFVEDILGKELRIASIAIKKSLPADYHKVTNEQLIQLAKELRISHITLLAKTEDDIIGVRSSDPAEINMSTKGWGYWYTAFKQMFNLQRVTVDKGLTMRYYWSGPIEVASSNPEHIDKWGYYYDGTTNYMINPYFRDNEALEYADKYGPERMMKKLTENVKGVLELAVFNPKKFGEEKEVVHLNGNSYVRLSAKPIWYGTYEFENTKKDKQYIRKAMQTRRSVSYIANLNGKRVQKTFVPADIDSSEPFVLGMTTDYGIIENQLAKELKSHVFFTLIFMAIVLTISLIISNKMTKPIGYIADQVNEIAKGHFGKTISIQRQDELGYLAQNVNAMSTSLKKYVTELKKSREMIEYQANHDPLTTLPNRRFAISHLAKLLEASKVNPQPISILFIDIDRFKNVNDSLGHSKGDELIQLISKRLMQIVEEKKAIISRQGGDEFLIVVENLNKNETLKLATKMVEELRKPYYLDNQEIFIGASCGISLFPDHSAHLETLIKYSDIAMYEAKNHGGNSVMFYCNAFSKKSNDRIRLESRLRKAIAEEKITLHYQPKVNAVTNRIVGAEALVRWHDDELGFISPSVFIPIAEETGLIQPLWEYIMKRACHQGTEWNEGLSEPITMAVNFSARQFQDTTLMVEQVNAILEECKFAPHLFEIEITESVLLYNTADTIAALKKLRDSGVRISVDDFGTGYSSLSYLRQFPIDTLKVDQSFIQGIDEEHNHTEITEAVINLARSLRMQVVAEGVEEEFQKHFLIQQQCVIMQGFLFSKPVDAAGFAGLLKKHIV